MITIFFTKKKKFQNLNSKNKKMRNRLFSVLKDIFLVFQHFEQWKISFSNAKEMKNEEKQKTKQKEISN